VPNGVAYLKRVIGDTSVRGEVEASPSEEAGQEPRQEGRADSGVVATATRGPEVSIKYRNPATGETWTGRGWMTSWLKRKQDAGEDIEKYRV
jgi:DNA-binding protein H-NS